MKTTLLTLLTLATSKLGLKVVLGDIHEFCYTDLQSSCVLYHIEGGYADGFNRIYLPSNLLTHDPEYHNLLANISIIAEPWSPVVDDMISQRGITPEFRSVFQDLTTLQNELSLAGVDGAVHDSRLAKRISDQDMREVKKIMKQIAEAGGCMVAGAGCGAGVGSAIATGGATLVAGVATAGACIKAVNCIVNNPLEN